MAPAITRNQQQPALDKSREPSQRPKSTITRPIISKISKTVSKSTPKPVAASAPKLTRPPPSTLRDELPTSSKKAPKPASVPSKTARPSPGLSLRNASSALASTSRKPKGVLSKPDPNNSLKKDKAARKARKNTVRKKVAWTAGRSNSPLPMAGESKNKLEPTGPVKQPKMKPKSSMVKEMDIAAMMAKTSKTRRRSNSEDSERRQDMEMLDDQGGEGEKGQRQEQEKKLKQLEHGKSGKKRPMKELHEEEEGEVEEEETGGTRKRLKESGMAVEKEEEKKEDERQEDVADEADDQDMDDGSMQSGRNGDVPIEEEDDDEKEQEEMDGEIDDFDMDDGSVQMDREGNVTMHDANDKYQVLDGSLQEEAEHEGDRQNVEEEEEEVEEDADEIPESDWEEEVGDADQANVEEGDYEGRDESRSSGSSIDTDGEDEEEGEEEEEQEEEEQEEEEQEEEEQEEEEQEEGEEEEEQEEGEEVEEEEIEPEEIEREWADDEAGGGEEREDEDEGAEREFEEGTGGDSPDANAGADAEEHAEQEGTGIDEEGNNNTTTSSNEEENAEIYQTVKDLIQNIPSKHFVYCRTLDQPDDIQHVAFKVYDVEERKHKFDTRNLDHDPEALKRLLGVAKEIYKKQHGWEFGNLKHDCTFFMSARKEDETTKAKPKTKKKATKGKPKTQGSEQEQAPTYKGHVTVVDGGGSDDDDSDDGGDEGSRQWDMYIERLAEEALFVLGTVPTVTFKPELEYMWIWGEKSLFPNYDLSRSDDQKLVGRLLVIPAGLDYEGGDFAFSCNNRCHYFDPKAEPCLIATLSGGGSFVDAYSLTSGYRIGLVYQLRVRTIKMAEQNTASNAVSILNDYEKEFLDGLATWRNRVRNADGDQRNGIHRTVYYILKRQVSGTEEIVPSADLTPAQKLQLAWLHKLCKQMPGKRIKEEAYEWLLHVDLAVLLCRTMQRTEKDGTISVRPGFQVNWTADADVETDDWDRNESEQGMEVMEEAVINFGDPELGSSGCDEYLCIRLNIA